MIHAAFGLDIDNYPDMIRLEELLNREAAAQFVLLWEGLPQILTHPKLVQENDGEDIIIGTLSEKNGQVSPVKMLLSFFLGRFSTRLTPQEGQACPILPQVARCRCSIVVVLPIICPIVHIPGIEMPPNALEMEFQGVDPILSAWCKAARYIVEHNLGASVTMGRPISPLLVH